MDVATRLRGCLLGLTVGDALGAPLTYESRARVRKRSGARGPKHYLAGMCPAGSIGHNTRMALFTADGMIRARSRLVLEDETDTVRAVHDAYMRWFHTLEFMFVDPKFVDGWLLDSQLPRGRHETGLRCAGPFLRATMGEPERPSADDLTGNGIARVAPAALWDHSGFEFDAFEEGRAYAALTHRHPMPSMAAGSFALMLARLIAGGPADAAIGEVIVTLRPHKTVAGVGTLIERIFEAVRLAFNGETGHAAVKKIGVGHQADETLAIGLFGALSCRDIRSGLRVAVAHAGHSESTGAIAGALLGAREGPDAIPKDLLEGLEARDVVEEIAADLSAHFLDKTKGIEKRDRLRYPPA